MNCSDDYEFGPNDHGELDSGCRKCNVAFGSSTELKLHFATAHNRQTFECFVCNKLFLQKYNFLAHIERYHDDIGKSFSCQFCDKVYTTKAALDSHMGVAHKNPTLICPLCQKVFPQKSALKRHVQKNHEHGEVSRAALDSVAAGSVQSGVLGHPYKCSTCSKSYKSQSGLTIHSKTKHQNTQHRCNLCGKSFSRASNVARHVETIHTMSKTFPCKWCGKEFRSTGGRDMHISAEHTGTRYDCNVCFKQFKRKGSLGRHLAGVHGQGVHVDNPEERYDCSVCFKQFSRRGSLIRHLSGVHGQGEERYKCTTCTKEFKQKSHLKTHLKNIHGLHEGQPGGGPSPPPTQVPRPSLLPRHDMIHQNGHFTHNL